MRSVLLNDPVWNASARILKREDAQAAEQIMVCNDLRGTVIAEIVS